jgi:rod shape determining protein RodA
LSIFISNITGILLFEFAIKLLRPHQQQRILTFLNPAADPLGSGYNALQAQIAIGSGGFFGRGFMEGTQTQMRFIPEQWTDFIFSVIGEEFGFLGSIIVIILFAIIFFRLLILAQKLKNRFESFVTLGVLLTLFFHFLINIGMNIGLAPIIGIPLPFISYGGTAFLTYSAMMGIIISFYRTNSEHV